MNIYILQYKTLQGQSIGVLPIAHYQLDDAIEMARSMMDVLVGKDELIEEEELTPNDPEADPFFRISCRNGGLYEVYRLDVQ